MTMPTDRAVPRRPPKPTRSTRRSSATAWSSSRTSCRSTSSTGSTDEVERRGRRRRSRRSAVQPDHAGVPRSVHEAGRGDAGHLTDLRDRRDVPPAAARSLRPGAAPVVRAYQLNLGHLLQRGPGADEQWLHRDEAVWSDVPRPHPELQLATVIAFVDFTRENGATRVVPGSHLWPDRQLVPAEQMLAPRRRPSRSRTRRCRRARP